jgi:multidrug efflux system outer membrane protein
MRGMPLAKFLCACCVSAGLSLPLVARGQPSSFEPVVSDPMLSPPPSSPRQIASWDEVLELIRTHSPDYISSYESVLRAEAQTRVTLAGVLPTLVGQAGYTHEVLSPLRVVLAGVAISTPPPDVVTATGTLSWSLLNPRGLYALGTAERNVEVARLSFEDRRRQIAVTVVGAVLATLAAARVADLNRTGLRAALQRLVLTQTRQQYGQGTALDVDRAQQDVAASRSLIITGDELLLRSRETLGEALGSLVPIAAPPGLDLDQFQIAVAHTCRMNDEIEHRPDVVAARGRVELAERAEKDAALMIAPSVTLGSQLNYSTEPVLAPNATWSVGGVLNIPLYDGGARYGALRDARAALEQARQALTAARLDAVVGSAQALRAIGVMTQSRDVARAQRDLAARIDQRTKEGYAQGLGTSLDLVTSAQALRQAEINLALLDFQVSQARANAVLVNAECDY